MSDERLRELERRWKETGSDEDEAAWLVERVRVGEKLDWESYSRLAELNVDSASGYLLARVERGDLGREQLELAAYCREKAARLALQDEAPEAVAFEKWLDGLTAWGVEAEAVADTAMKNFILPHERFEDPEEAEALLQRLRAARAWLREPSEAQAELAWYRLPQPGLASMTLSWVRLADANNVELRKAVLHALLPWALGHRELDSWITMDLSEKLPGVRFVGRLISPVLKRLGFRTRHDGPTL